MSYGYGYLVKDVKNLYDKCKACVRLWKGVDDYLEVKRGLSYGCVMSACTFNVFFGRRVELARMNGWEWKRVGN